ncbi:hypothetical protein M0R45_019707 [Rubus argutus]|uniref:Uncharacterized protein n=1 Tax=Rubus argutus TaxID=59490 RepID=A0AAW1X841_RUBAR
MESLNEAELGSSTGSIGLPATRAVMIINGGGRTEGDVDDGWAERIGKIDGEIGGGRNGRPAQAARFGSDGDGGLEACGRVRKGCGVAGLAGLFGDEEERWSTLVMRGSLRWISTTAEYRGHGGGVWFGG